LISGDLCCRGVVYRKRWNRGAFWDLWGISGICLWGFILQFLMKNAADLEQGMSSTNNVCFQHFVGPVVIGQVSNI
jgi:hypothetical protein